MAGKKNLGVSRDSYLAINKDKFREVFILKRLNLEEVSVSLNYSAGYLNNLSSASGSGQLQKQAVLLLKYEYGIEPDEYSLEKHPYTADSQKGPTRNSKQFVQSEAIDYDRIQQMIDGAVDKAVGELKIDYAALHKVLYAAMYEAFKKVYNEPIGVYNAPIGDKNKNKIAITDNRKKGA